MGCGSSINQTPSTNQGKEIIKKEGAESGLETKKPLGLNKVSSTSSNSIIVQKDSQKDPEINNSISQVSTRSQTINQNRAPDTNTPPIPKPESIPQSVISVPSNMSTGKEAPASSSSNIAPAALTAYKSIYKAIKIGTIILIRDSFHSKYSGKLMYKWREAEIIDLDQNNPTRIYVHFIGWNTTFDTWLDIEEEINKIAPIGLLSKPDIDAGIALDTSQMQLVKYYLITGNSVSQDQQKTQSPTTLGLGHPGSASTSNTNLSSVVSSPHRYPSQSSTAINSPAPSSRMYALQQTSPLSDHLYPPVSYDVGQQLDVLDIFYRPGSDTPSAKWRKAKIIEKRDTKIRVSYIGWDSKFDETLDIFDNANRISAFGTKSIEQTSTSIATSAQKTPETNRKATKFTFSFSAPPPSQDISQSGLVEAGNGQKRQAEGEEEEEVEEGGEEETEEEGDSVREAGSGDKSTSDQTIKKKKEKTKKSLSEKFGKIVSRTVGKFSLSNSTTNGTEAVPSAPKSATVIESTNRSTRSDPAGGNASNTAASKGGGEDGKSLLDHEPTAEEIAAFEAEINKERVFSHTLQSHGYHIIEIEGDGNCLFRAISHQLYLNEDYHEQFRQACVEHLRKHQKRFEQFIVDELQYEDYLAEMAKSGTWADDLEIRAMEEILDRNIHIYSSNSTNPKDYLVPVNENPEEEKLMQGVAPINLSYHGQSHYNSIYYDRTPLPLPPRQTKVLLTARVALFEGKSLPSPSKPSSLQTSSNSNINNSPRNGMMMPHFAHYQSLPQTQPQPLYYPANPAIPSLRGSILQQQNQYLQTLQREHESEERRRPSFNDGYGSKSSPRSTTSNHSHNSSSSNARHHLIARGGPGRTEEFSSVNYSDIYLDPLHPVSHGSKQASSTSSSPRAASTTSSRPSSLRATSSNINGVSNSYHEALPAVGNNGSSILRANNYPYEKRGSGHNINSLSNGSIGNRSGYYA